MTLFLRPTNNIPDFICNVSLTWQVPSPTHRLFPIPTLRSNRSILARISIIFFSSFVFLPLSLSKHNNLPILFTVCGKSNRIMFPWTIGRALPHFSATLLLLIQDRLEWVCIRSEKDPHHYVVVQMVPWLPLNPRRSCTSFNIQYRLDKQFETRNFLTFITFQTLSNSFPFRIIKNCADELVDMRHEHEAKEKEMK